MNNASTDEYLSLLNLSLFCHSCLTYDMPFVATTTPISGSSVLQSSIVIVSKQVEHVDLL